MASKLDKLPFKLLILITISIVAVLIFVLAIFLASRVSSPEVTIAIPATPIPNYTQYVEIEALKTQLQDSRSYHDRLLQVVLWSIGGTVALGGILFGFGWFNHIRMTEHERTRLAVTEADLSSIKRDVKGQQVVLVDMAIRTAMEKATNQATLENFPDAYRLLSRTVTSGRLEHIDAELTRELANFVKGLVDFAWSKGVPMEDVDSTLVRKLLDLLRSRSEELQIYVEEDLIEALARVHDLKELSQGEDELPNGIDPIH